MPESLFYSSAPGTLDVGQVVHELNNALAPIIMSVELLRRKTADPDTQRQLDLLAGHAWRGAEIVRRILVWADRGGGPLRRKHLRKAAHKKPARARPWPGGRSAQPGS